MQKISTAVIGCGARGTGLAQLIQGSQILELVGVMDVDAARAEALGQRMGVAATTDLSKLLDQHDLASVVIATDARWHTQVALQCIAAHKHLYVEKPLADSAQSCRQVVDAAEAEGIIGVVGYQFRQSTLASVLEEHVPEIQPVQSILTSQRPPMNPQFFFPAHYGGVSDMLTHTIHAALWLMGGTPLRVSASLRRGSILGDQTLDAMTILIDMDQDRSATVMSSMFGSHTPNIYSFMGLRGSVTTTDMRKVHIVKHDPITKAGAALPPGIVTTDVEVPGQGDTTGLLLEHFGELVAGTTTVQRAATLREGMWAVAVTEAAVLCMENGRKIAIAEVTGETR